MVKSQGIERYGKGYAKSWSGINNSELLNSIIENSITIIIALIAGIIALYQVKSNIVSSTRINWIENLRLSISEYNDATLDQVCRPYRSFWATR